MFPDLEMFRFGHMSEDGCSDLATCQRVGAQISLAGNSKSSIPGGPK